LDFSVFDSTENFSLMSATKEVVKSSATYQGEFNDKHEKHGQGVLTWDDGDRFEGTFENDQKVYGTFTWNCGDKYTGQWKSSLMDGTGTYYYKDGRKYEGQWRGGFKEGDGIFTWPSGMSQKKKKRRREKKRKRNIKCFRYVSYARLFLPFFPGKTGSILIENFKIFENLKKKKRWLVRR
jgi:hypothetical protein